MKIFAICKIEGVFAAILVLALPNCAVAFDSSRILEGTYYNGADVNGQIWSPLVIVEKGKLLDPFELVMTRSMKDLTGPGRTSALKASSAFLHRGCRVAVELGVEKPLIAAVPNIFVAKFMAPLCALEATNALDELQQPVDQRGDPVFPTTLVLQPLEGARPLWLYGIPPMLAGKNNPSIPLSDQELGGSPSLVHAVVSRASFATLPIIEPDLGDAVFRAKNMQLKYGMDAFEGIHRMHNVVISREILNSANELVRGALWERFYPKLENNLRGRFGGISQKYFELGLIQGVDIDNTRSFDYVGVARIGAITNAGPWRWVDVVWCWRSGLGRTREALQVIRTSEGALYAPDNRYFEDQHPSLWSPNLVVSAFADFDKDKIMEVVTSLIRPVGIATDRRSPPSKSGAEIWLRDSAIHTWVPNPSNATNGSWNEIFRTSAHEARIEHFDVKTTRIERFGE